jgi:hypothetical protein
VVERALLQQRAQNRHVLLAVHAQLVPPAGACHLDGLLAGRRLGRDVVVRAYLVERGEYLRYLTLCSTEEGYNEACERLRKALETRGYSKSEIQGEKDKVPWVSKQEVIRKREEGEKNSASKAGAPGIPVVVPDKQGLREWWEQCTRQSITENFGEYLTNAEMEMLPSRMFKCLSRTESTGDFIKRNRKNKYRDKRGQK